MIAHRDVGDHRRHGRHTCCSGDHTMQKPRFLGHPRRSARTNAPRRGTFLFVALLAACAVLARTQSAHACPNCAAGVQARAEVLNEAFESNLFVTLLPFLIIGAICFGAEQIGRPMPRISQAATARNKTKSGGEP
jgi:hypothetical protein